MAESVLKARDVARPVFDQQASGMRQSIRDDIAVWERSVAGKGIIRVYAASALPVEKGTKRPKRKASATKKK